MQKIVDCFYRQKAAMVIGAYRMCDFDLNTLPPGIIDHKEWTDENGPNNALASTDSAHPVPSSLLLCAR